MTAIDINKFAGRDDMREWMNKPFPLDGRLIATDGKVLFRSNTKVDGTPPATAPTELLRHTFKCMDQAQFHPLPQLDFPEPKRCGICRGTGKAAFVECHECHGEGDVIAETKFNEYEVECKSCRGYGRIHQKSDGTTCVNCAGRGEFYRESQRMSVPGFPFDLNPGLLLLIANVPDLLVCAVKDDRISGALAFRCHDGDGLIMGMRPEEGRKSA